MPYVPVPESGQSLGQTRDQLRTNIADLKSSIAINHYDLDTANVGKHKYVVLPVEGSAPSAASGEGVLYTKTVSGITRLFWKRDAAATEIQLTGINPILGGSSCATVLPGNIMIQGGVASVNPNTTTAIAFPTAYSSALYTVVVTPIRNSSNVDIVYYVTGSLSTFTVRNTSGSISAITWMSLGV